MTDRYRVKILNGAIDYVEAHLADSELSPDEVAASQHVSTRTLQRIFERNGTTLGAWVRMRRLERCRIDLTDARYSRVPVSRIGARWGIWDAAQFSRLFKARFGVSPRVYRKVAISAAGVGELRASA